MSIELEDKEALRLGMAIIQAASGHFENPDFTVSMDPSTESDGEG